MDLKSKFYTIFKSLNPYNYQELSEHKFSSVLKYYFFIIFFGVVITSLMFIPFLYSTGSFVSGSVGHFENLTISSNFKLRESFNLMSDPAIRFEAEKKNITNELILISPDFISYKRYLLFGAQKDVPLAHGVDVTDSARAKMLITLGVFFLLPSLFFWGTIFSIIYFSVIILLTLLFVLIVMGLLRISLGFMRLLKLCIYSSTIFILLQLFLLPFYRIFWIPLVAYWLLVLIVLFLWRDDIIKGKQGNTNHGEQTEDEEDYSSKDSIHHGSKTREIFGNKSDSGLKSGLNHKIEARESYDVDEHGNLKGLPKKHKHTDDEGDGYVEL